MKNIPENLKTTAIALFIMTLLASSLHQARAAGPSAQALSFTCAGCHGTDGSSVGPSSPHIAGLNEEYFIDTMKAYQDDKGNPTIMNRLAKGYTEEQITAMAGFFAKQELRLSPQSHDKGLAEKGAKLHDKYCEKCHEEGGRTASDGGTLAGQWIPYLHYSMADYQNGKREMTKKMKKKMDKMLKKEGDSSIEALINYYASQN